MISPLIQLAQILIFTLLFGVLGTAVRSLFPKREASRESTGAAIESIGIGLSALIVIVFLLGFFNGGLAPANLYIVLGFVAALGIFQRLRNPSLQPLPRKTDFLFFLLLAVLLLSRLLQIRGLLVPNWVDGLNHQLLLERWDGLATISSDRLYHAGFHMAVLALHYLFGWDFPALMLAFGQWLCVFSGLALYIFLKDFFGRPALAFASASIYSLFLLFPSYLISWGRYPLLQGLALLPFALSLTLGWLRGTERTLPPALAALIALILSHYGMILFWGAFLVAQIANLRDLSAQLKRLAWLILPLTLALLPRVIILFQRTDFLHSLLARGDTSSASDAAYVWGLIASHDWLFLLLCGLGALFALARERRVFFIPISWAALVLGLVFAQNVVFGSSAFSYENALIFLSVPVSVLAGLTVEKIYASLNSVRPALAWTAIAVFLAAGVFTSARIINPDTVLFTDSDRAAMDWIRANTPPDAVFLVNSAWWGDRYAPSDGGGWIEPLTGRQTVFAKTAGDLVEASGLIEQDSLNFVYLSGGYGELSLVQFVENPSYELVYHQNGVDIYRVTR